MLCHSALFLSNYILAYILAAIFLRSDFLLKAIGISEIFCKSVAQGFPARFITLLELSSGYSGIVLERHTADEAARFMLDNNLRCTEIHQLAKAPCVNMHIIGKAVAAEIFYAFP